MIRSMVVRALLVAIGAAGAGFVILWRAPAQPVQSERGAPQAPVTSVRPFNGVPAGAACAQTADIDRRVQRLEARVAAAAAERHRLGEQLAVITTLLAARGTAPDETASTHVAAGAPLAAPAAPTDAGPKALDMDEGNRSPMERALAAAGLDAATVQDIKRRQDENTMSEIYLRDQATREQWLDSPRFAAEMAAIEAQRTPLRDEIGDDAYDRYLFALGQTNRVRIEDVLQQSPAAQAGLQAGDLIVRYGEARLFTPSELVNETRSGSRGEPVQLEFIRNGARFEVEVPRGPLGLRVAATQGNPETS